MHIHWWQSIRWRLALGSMIFVILATSILALSAILSIVYFYGKEQIDGLNGFATRQAQSISAYYPSANGSLSKAVDAIFPDLTQKRLASTGLIKNSISGDDYLFLVLAPAHTPSHPLTAVYPVLTKLDIKNQDVALWLSIRGILHRPSSHNNLNADAEKLSSAVLKAQSGVQTVGEIGQRYLGVLPHPFIAQPIKSGEVANNHVIGVLLMLPLSAVKNILPPFVLNTGQVVLRASIAIAILAALAAIFFARTITRPLAKVTSATRVLASGDYSARVPTGAAGELGELAHNFNDMAAELQRDVEELRKQELWRRELIMSITHDLATPLTAIAGLGEALVDGVNQSREEYEETGRVIVKETLRLRRLVKDLHMMAKVEAGALQPQCRPVRLAPLVDEVLAVLITEFERGKVEPRNMISYKLPTVEADPDMLTRVISNLCDNALQHTPPDGTITIEVTPQDAMLAISVTDTGAGIPPEALERVFERFFRADSARQSTTGGSGLGLAIVRAIVEAHGGRVWAENVPGTGARFTFTLPLTLQAPLLADETTLRLPHMGTSHLKKLDEQKPISP